MTTHELARHLRKLPNLPVFVVYDNNGYACEVTIISHCNSKGKELGVPIKTYPRFRKPKTLVVLYGELQ